MSATSSSLSLAQHLIRMPFSNANPNANGDHFVGLAVKGLR